MREVVLNLKHPNNWISEVTKDSPTKVRILDCKVAPGEGGVQQLIEVDAPDEEIAEFITKVKKNRYIAEANIVRTKRGRALGTVHVRDSVLCAAALGSDVFCRSCLFTSNRKPDGTTEWTLALNGRESLKELLARIESLDVQVKVARLTSIADREQLTQRQREILQIALEKGFFDYPRKISVRQLALLAGASASTVSEVLRRAHKKIVSEYLHTPKE